MIYPIVVPFKVLNRFSQWLEKKYTYKWSHQGLFHVAQFLTKSGNQPYSIIGYYIWSNSYSYFTPRPSNNQDIINT